MRNSRFKLQRLFPLGTRVLLHFNRVWTQISQRRRGDTENRENERFYPWGGAEAVADSKQLIFILSERLPLGIAKFFSNLFLNDVWNAGAGAAHGRNLNPRPQPKP
jgi:hypothetical protein